MRVYPAAGVDGRSAVVPIAIGRYVVPKPNLDAVIEPSAGEVVTVAHVAVVPSVVRNLPVCPD